MASMIRWKRLSGFQIVMLGLGMLQWCPALAQSDPPALSIGGKPWAKVVGTALSELPIKLVDNSNCVGNFEKAAPLKSPSPGGPHWQTSGWAWDRAAKAVPKYVLMVRDGYIVGYGVPKVERRDVQRARSEVLDSLNGWVGYASAPTGSKVFAYTWSETKGTACPIGAMTMQ